MKYQKRSRVNYRVKLNNKKNYPVLYVSRSQSNIYAQVIQDGKVLAYANSLEKDFKFNGYNVEGAKEVGMMVGKRLKDIGINKVIFNRGEYKYHGRIAALADGAREHVEI